MKCIIRWSLVFFLLFQNTPQFFFTLKYFIRQKWLTFQQPIEIEENNLAKSCIFFAEKKELKPPNYNSFDRKSIISMSLFVCYGMLKYSVWVQKKRKLRHKTNIYFSLLIHENNKWLIPLDSEKILLRSRIMTSRKIE